jgi:hypothetical protein
MTLSLCCSGKVFHVLRPDVDANCACRAASSQRGKVGWGETAESSKSHLFGTGRDGVTHVTGRERRLIRPFIPFTKATRPKIVSHYPAPRRPGQLRPAVGQGASIGDLVVILQLLVLWTPPDRRAL